MDVVDVTERLMAEFEDRLALNVISQVVNRSRRDLEGTALGSLPEQVERLARQRLLEAAQVPRQRSSAGLRLVRGASPRG